jgi:hypothetical protein
MSLENFYRSLYSKKDELSKMEEEIEEWKDTPRYKMGMFVKLIINGTLFRKQLSNMFEGSNKIDIGNAGEFIMYNRAWYWIKDFNPEDPDWVESVKPYEEEEVVRACDLTISYFENLEEFEKCSLLLSIKKLFKNA